jgi:opacity protein-like surface antigen
LDESRNYTVGPTVEFHLPRNFGIETGFLYKRIGTSSDFHFDAYRALTRSRANSFEIPVVGKYYVRPSAGWSPYLGLGVALRRAWQTTDSSITGPSDLPFPTGNFQRSDLSAFGAGAVGAAGVQFRHGRWKVSPEFRYTRWSMESQVIPRNPNQVEFLVGVSF